MFKRAWGAHGAVFCKLLEVFLSRRKASGNPERQTYHLTISPSHLLQLRQPELLGYFDATLSLFDCDALGLVVVL